MRIGIITFHASHNYGSMLQAYALQVVLGKMGHQVETINLRHDSQRKMYAHPLDIKRRGLIRVCHDIIISPFVTLMAIRKWRKYENFLYNNLQLSREYYCLQDLEKANLNYDLLIVGSDQIWNTHCKDFNLAYFGNFIGEDARKISYAPSMGTNPEVNVDKSIVEKYCKGFAAISVREERTKLFLQNCGISQDIKITLDPTLLLDDADYQSLSQTPALIRDRYVFFYDPFIKPNNLKIASNIAQEMGLPVVCDRYYYKNHRKSLFNIKFYTNVGPSEFLNLTKNATIICGRSFHSIVFAILMKKDFLAIDGDKDSRMANLLKSLGLEHRIIRLDCPENYPKDHIENWDEIHSRLTELRHDSLNWLSAAIDKDNFNYSVK